MTGGFSAASGLLRAFGGDPKFRTLSNTLWRPLQTEIDSSLKDYGDIKSKGNAALDEFISKYLANTKSAESQTGQEVGAIDRYYDGSMDSLLRDIRSRRQGAIHDAADLAGKKAVRSLNLSRLGNDGGSSSYDARILARTLGDIDTEAAVDDSTQERSDLSWLEGNKLGLTGRRQAMMDALAGRELVPEDTRRNMFSQNLGFLGNLGQLDRANKIYGVQKKTTGLERWANALDAVQGGLNQDVATGASIGSSL